jgi:hypothetical protein
LCKFVGKRLPKHARNNVRVKRVYIGPFGPLYDMHLGKAYNKSSTLPAKTLRNMKNVLNLAKVSRYD